MTTTPARLRRSTVALALVGIAAATAGAASTASTASADPGAHDRDGAGRAVAELRRAIAPYRDVQQALADGYLATEECASSPAGGMGRHYVKPALLTSPPNPATPPVLLYGQGPDGALQLLGAEFLVVDADQDLSTDGDRPSLFGQAFDGPMPGHEPGMPSHYDLHVWTHRANPAGVFSAWNPTVSC